MKIVSGGQTGVDRAALDAALEYGVEAGGWCPEGRKAEDGVIPAKYPVQELPQAGPRQRTKKNVLDSDGTVIIYFKYPVGGTQETILFCMKAKKPYLLLDATELSPERAAQRVNSFTKTYNMAVLNVAGPRGSREPGAYAYAKEVIAQVLKDQKGSGGKDKMEGKDISVVRARQIAFEEINRDSQESLELVECTEPTAQLACYLKGKRSLADCYFFHVGSRTPRIGSGRIIGISKQDGEVVCDGDVGE
ncbi:MAG: putative molybdenum carrier protein [Proteobacteria bacterium]|nr:hypothetical protein [Desulfocapsa sp.]MBU3943130.1 putative molybdenum carrier protein [Pseudomonadota bacterium]MCG2745708.1 putative molybdenum carrier protein [Desulfobacteraceae bacterium]MBU3984896.1 putative molybdenum carrier protein [Pseudomonadota bacterium]MBU4041573.1 putative molybdenum carrier protein [Pseudomonadota bacterium]